jgi:serine/threonine protein kinase
LFQPEASAERDMTPQQTLYELDPQLIGCGRCSRVYRGRHRTDGHEAAVKIANPTVFALARIRREIDIQSSLEHPNIMGVLAEGEEGLWYSMQIAAGTLASRGPFPSGEWKFLRRALREAGRGLAYAHAENVVHRDLSPSKLLDVSGRWVVANWGVAQIPSSQEGRLAVQEQIFGTPDFTAPEVLVDPPRATAAADVYSLGRLAAWGTGIERSERSSSRRARFGAWRGFVDGTTDSDPRRRWSLPRALDFLEQVDQTDVLYDDSIDPCPHCHANVGYDSGTRCLRCHVSNPSYA